MRDPAEDNDDERDARLDDENREARWAAFIQVVLAFEETEGWSDVLAAISAAMREQERLSS